MQPQSPTRAKGKASEVITLASARNLHHACKHALPQGGRQARRGCPKANVSAPAALNLFVTIKWSLTKTGEDNFTALRNQRFCRWLRTRSKQLGINVKPTYVYAREGDHVHWIVHVPEELVAEFKELVPRWVTSLEQRGKGARKRAENHEPAPEGVVDINPVRNSVAARKYIMKGIDPRFAFMFGLKEPAPQGIVIGRRTGVSRNLGRPARRKAGYRAQKPSWWHGNGRSLHASSPGKTRHGMRGKYTPPKKSSSSASRPAI